MKKKKNILKPAKFSKQKILLKKSHKNSNQSKKKKKTLKVSKTNKHSFMCGRKLKSNQISS